MAATAVVTGKAVAGETAIPAPDHSIPQSGFHGRQESRRVWSGDPRSKKVVFLSHCMLNQNARMINCADFPAMFEPLLDYLKNSKMGIIQMTCPELYCLGLGRFDVRVGLESPAGNDRLQRLIDDVVFTIQEYQFQGFEILGILGKEGSPSCGVTRTWLDERQQDGQGVYVRELKKRLAAEELEIPVIGVADFEQEKAIGWLEERLGT
jgi:predicted secreted protein